MEEIWKSLKDIVECGDYYEVSNLGNVRNTKNNTILKGQSTYKGYYRVSLYLNGKCKRYLIHRLVALIFIPNLENKLFVNHLNGDKSDNNVINLEWSTNSENTNHAFKNGLNKNFGINHSFSKLTDEDVLKIRQMYSTGNYSQETLAKMFNISETPINKIIKRETWKHI